MNTKFKKILHGTFLGTLIFMSGVSFAIAAAPVDYTVLAPLPGTTNVPNCNSTVGANGTGGCQTNLSNYLPGLFNLLIGVGAVAAFVIITIFGFEYMLTDSLLNKQRAKEWVVNALWGLGLIIFAYVILYTINPALLAGSLNIGTPTISTSAGATSGGGTGTGGTGTGGTGTGGANGIVGYINTCAVQTSPLCISETNNRAMLLAGNVNMNSAPPCNGIQQSLCTNVANVTSNAIKGTVALQAACSAAQGGSCITVTGATEHQPANMIDMSATANLNAWLGAPANPASNAKYPKQVVANGQTTTVTFTYEVAGQLNGNASPSTGNHWHVTFP